MTDGPQDHAKHQRLVTDLRDLIEVVDRRLNELRQHGNTDAVGHMEEIRNHALLSLESLDAEQGDK